MNNKENIIWWSKSKKSYKHNKPLRVHIQIRGLPLDCTWALWRWNKTGTAAFFWLCVRGVAVPFFWSRLRMDGNKIAWFKVTCKWSETPLQHISQTPCTVQHKT